MGPESGTRPSQRYRSCVYVGFDIDGKVAGFATVRPAPRDIIVSDVRDPSGIGIFRNDQKPSLTLYSLDPPGTVSSNINILQISFQSASRPVYANTHKVGATQIFNSSSSVNASVGNSTFMYDTSAFFTVTMRQ